MTRTLPVFQEVFSKYDDLNASVQENVSGIRVVKAFVREDYENKKFSKAAEQLCRLFIKAESLLALNNPIMMLVIYGCIICLSWSGAVSYPHLELADGTVSEKNIGGAAMYALSGMRLWTKNCKLVCKAGADYKDTYGKWLENNGITQSSVNVAAEHCSTFVLRYAPDGSFTPIPVYSYTNVGYRCV